MIKTVTGLPRQTIHDLAIKHYGDESGLAQLLRDNEGIHELELIEDLTVNIDQTVVVNRAVTNYYANKNIVTY